MGAKVSQEMKKALKLVEQGVSVREAAKRAGVDPSAVYKALKRG